LLENGGLAATEERNIAKAKLLYDFIDSSDFYVNPVDKADRFADEHSLPTRRSRA
jgi:phosphoserine aminotransferase